MPYNKYINIITHLLVTYTLFGSYSTSDVQHTSNYSVYLNLNIYRYLYIVFRYQLI